ncbi:E3 ubiquitin-protein ligase DTX3L [Parambassis ranga]|uniref:E3 ubiquitin-protein ligase n=1 Tax=Parambassis ranga TaxID=210632 RepID=A0A6P7J0M9_9TELE|nr:E3 ubiquitin-protein ligase DTX3L-like [Parambassis ranga]
MEFITDISLVIDETNYEDPRRLKGILSSYSPERKGSCYKVKGNIEQLKHLVVKLESTMHHSSTATRGRTRQQDAHRVSPLDVSADVMEYIEEKYADKLKTIQGKSIEIKKQPVPRAAPGSTVQLIFRPHPDSLSTADRLYSDLVRQRFITFYQRTASDLQVTSVSLRSHDQADLKEMFPHILFKPSNNKHEFTVTGPFAHIFNLKQLLSEKARDSGNRVQADMPYSGSKAPSPTHSKDPEDSCPICMEPIAEKEKKTLRCKHSFCRDCLKRAFEYKPVCPTCGQLYGTLTGTQPEGGTMKVTTHSSSLPGYKNYGTIIIEYHIPSGIQKEEHPNPGQPYEGVFRTAYLPDSSEGRMILNLLKRAFDQRLIFTIGRSTTSGRNNMVTWNDIHHKTTTHGGPTHYGYPDSDYLKRVQDELRVKGIE